MSYNKYFNNTKWLLLEKIIRILLTLFVTILLARFLGPEQFGILSYALAFVGLFSVLSTLGLDKLINKEISINSLETDTILGTSFIMKLLGATILIFLAVIIIDVVKPYDTQIHIMVLILSISFFFKSFEVIKYWFESNVNSSYSALAETLTIIISSIIKIILVTSNASLISITYAFLIESILFSIFLLIVYKYNKKTVFNWKVNISKFKYLFNQAWPLILAGALYTIYTKIDQIMLGTMIGDESVGIYAAAVKLSEGWLFLPVVIATSFFPAMLNSRKNNYEKYIIQTQHLLNIMALIGIIISIVGALLSSIIIDITFGSNYKESVIILIVHIWGGIFIAMSTIVYRYLIAENLQKLSFYRGLTGLIINIIFNLILIPGYGALGAAISTVISQICALYVFNYWHPKTKKMFIMQSKALFLINIISSIHFIKSLRENK